MKKLLIVFLTILSTLSCVRTLIDKVENKQEITYVVRPLTKTISANQTLFADTNVFQSYAYMLPAGTTWKYSKTTGDNGSEVYFNTDVIITKDTVKNVWRDSTFTWYWPKNNTLTFFAWSLNSPSLEFPETSPTIVTCTDQNGIVAMYYDIEKNKNVDFLVADIAPDKTINEYMFTTLGVPTLFRHKLSKFSATVCEKEDYEGITFTVNKIVFNNLNKDGNYTQDPDTLVVGTARSEQVYTDNSQTVTKDKTEIKNTNQVLYLPQDFDDDKTVTITYTVQYDTDKDGVVNAAETVTETYKLSDLFNEGFRAGKHYILNINFTMDEILWDPVVQNWVLING